MHIPNFSYLSEKVRKHNLGGVFILFRHCTDSAYDETETMII